MKLKKAITELPEQIRNDLLKINVDEVLDWPGIIERIEDTMNYVNWAKYARDEKLLIDGIKEQESFSVLSKQVRLLKEEKVKVSENIIKNKWTCKISKNKNEIIALLKKYFEISNELRTNISREAWFQLKDKFDAICKEIFKYFPVWIVTNLSVRRTLSLISNYFDLVILDEASQCDIASALPILFRAKRMTVIGDPKQLRHISIISKNKNIKLAEKYTIVDLLPTWSYRTKSIYDLTESITVGNNKPPIKLKEHYRSSPEIILFSNKKFYNKPDESLIIRTDIGKYAEKFESLSIGLYWHDVKGTVPYIRKSAYNLKEIEFIVNKITEWIESGKIKNDISIGIVTPFSMQMTKIKETLNKQPWFNEFKNQLIVGTAHVFQGDETDILFFSPVVSEGIYDRKAKWVSETEQLLNVAVTRARAVLHVVGNMDKCKEYGGVLKEFAEYVTNMTVCPQLTEPEKRMDVILQEIKKESNIWYRAQYQERIPKPILDFLIVTPSGIKIDLEVDDMRHMGAEQYNNDRVRDKYLEDKGYKVIRIKVRDILFSPEKVKEFIEKII